MMGSVKPHDDAPVTFPREDDAPDYWHERKNWDDAWASWFTTKEKESQDAELDHYNEAKMSSV